MGNATNRVGNNEKKNARFLRRATGISVAVFAVLTAAAIATLLLYPSLCYRRADTLALSGAYADAAALFDRADGYADAAARAEDCRKAGARELLGAGAYDDALSLLALAVADADTNALRDEALLLRGTARYAAGDDAGALSDLSALQQEPEAVRTCILARYRLAQAAVAAGDWEQAKTYLDQNTDDAASRELMTAVKYGMAEALLAAGDAGAAYDLLSQLSAAGVEVQPLFVAAARVLYPDSFGELDDNAVFELITGNDPKTLERVAMLSAAHALLPDGILAVGNAHTVALTQDGTVFSCGDDSFGQCGVSDWTGITAIAAGASHTVGLRSDGTVVACGDNTYGQCEVSAYSDVRAICAAGADTVLMLRDGSVVSIGFHSYTVTDAWADADMLALGGYALMALTPDGSVLSTRASFVNESYYSLLDLSAGAVYSAAVTRSGKLVTTAPQTPVCEDLIRVCATPVGIIGIAADGTARAFAFRDGDLPEVSAWQNVVALAGSGRHVVAVFADGTLSAVGDNECGQCETGAWRLW